MVPCGDVRDSECLECKGRPCSLTDTSPHTLRLLPFDTPNKRSSDNLSSLHTLIQLVLALVVVRFGAATVSFLKKYLASNSNSNSAITTSSMSKSKSKSSQFDDKVTQFITITNASKREATKLLQKHNQVEAAIEAYYNSNPSNTRPNIISSQKLNTLFDSYKALGNDNDDDNISIDGTIKLCEDLGVDPEDVALLAVAYELKAPGVGVFTREGWKNGWKALEVDSIPAMKITLARLRNTLATDFAYFRKVYLFTFDFGKTEGQRSLPMDIAQAFWGLLLPHAIAGGALARVESEDTDRDNDDNDEEDESMVQTGGPGWTDRHTQLWFDFLNEKGGKGVSRDTWNMFISFIHTIDPQFRKYDPEAAWPSLIDDFVEWGKSRV